MTLNGTANQSSMTTIGFREPNGACQFAIGVISGFSTTHQGSVLVEGRAVTENVPWTVFTVLVTFSEAGLTSSTTWSVTHCGVAHASSTNAIPVSEPNGSCVFSVPNVSGYTMSPSHGIVNVTGSPVSQSIVFTPAQPLTTSPPSTDWTAFVAVGIVAAVVLLRRPRRPPPHPPKPASPWSEGPPPEC